MTLSWFDAFAKDYDAWYREKLGSFVDKVQKQLIEELAKPEAGEITLDIGSGTGNYSIWLARKGLYVTAIDESKEMMAISKKKVEKDNLNIDMYLGKAESLPFTENSFDLVVSVTTIEFVDNPAQVLREAIRVLKPGGRLVIGVLTKDSPWGDFYQSKIKEDPNNVYAKAHLFTEEELCKLLNMHYVLKKGLYVDPLDEFDEKVACKIEQKKQYEQANRAGFYVIRWIRRQNDDIMSAFTLSSWNERI
ncbi:MAG: class I SAM-dependent methyltransferase [Kosmotoga sp.]|nr:MAG: class I SAM-dependent methyltransferase [Kosmotoga sp.]